MGNHPSNPGGVGVSSWCLRWFWCQECPLRPPTAREKTKRRWVPTLRIFGPISRGLKTYHHFENRCVTVKCFVRLAFLTRCTHTMRHAWPKRPDIGVIGFVRPFHVDWARRRRGQLQKWLNCSHFSFEKKWRIKSNSDTVQLWKTCSGAADLEICTDIDPLHYERWRRLLCLP